MANDLAKLQGAWSLSSLEMNGAVAPAGGGIEIDGDRFHSIGMGAEYSGKVEIDDTAKPKHFDLVFTKGPEAGNRNRGIYQLKGNTWKLCLDMTGKSRPSEFRTAPGSGVALEVFTRGAAPQDEPDAVAAPTAGDTGGELAGEWQMLAAFQEGHALDASMVKTGRRVTTANQTTTYFGKQVFMKATYTTDPTQTPKTIDLMTNGKTQLGIYEVAGDTMKICFGKPGQARPTDFEARAGDGRTSAVWKLVKR